MLKRAEKLSRSPVIMPLISRWKEIFKYIRTKWQYLNNMR